MTGNARRTLSEPRASRGPTRGAFLLAHARQVTGSRFSPTVQAYALLNLPAALYFVEAAPNEPVKFALGSSSRLALTNIDALLTATSTYLDKESLPARCS